MSTHPNNGVVTKAQQSQVLPLVGLLLFWRGKYQQQAGRCVCQDSRFPCCVLLALSWDTNKIPSTNKFSRAINWCQEILWAILREESASNVFNQTKQVDREVQIVVDALKIFLQPLWIVRSSQEQDSLVNIVVSHPDDFLSLKQAYMVYERNLYV